MVDPYGPYAYDRPLTHWLLHTYTYLTSYNLASILTFDLTYSPRNTLSDEPNVTGDPPEPPEHLRKRQLSRLDKVQGKVSQILLLQGHLLSE